MGVNNPASIERDRLLEQLLAKAEEAGLEAEDLDETVHELASSIAADTNNAGLDGQIGYLIDQLGGPEASKQLDRLAGERSGTTDHE